MISNTLRSALSKQLIKHEGLRLKPYKCPKGRLTVGVGHNLDSGGITEKQALMILDDDINASVANLRRKLNFFDELPETVQGVLINMCFNMGINSLMAFKNTLRNAENWNWEGMANEMLDSDWAKEDCPSRAEELSETIRGLAGMDRNVLLEIRKLQDRIRELEQSVV